MNWQLDAGADIYVSPEGELGLPSAESGDIEPVPAETIAAEAPLRFWQILRIGHRRVLLGGDLAEPWALFVENHSPVTDQAEPDIEEVGLSPETPLEERERLADLFRRRAGKPAEETWSRRRLRRELDKLEEVQDVG